MTATLLVGCLGMCAVLHTHRKRVICTGMHGVRITHVHWA